MRALQVEASGAKIAELESGLVAELLLDRCAPLLDVLRRRVQLQAGETDDHTDPTFSAQNLSASPDAVQEFQVETGSYSADMGGAGGGQMFAEQDPQIRCCYLSQFATGEERMGRPRHPETGAIEDRRCEVRCACDREIGEAVARIFSSELNRL